MAKGDGAEEPPGMPEQDQLVIATVKKIMPYGAFCTLDEYGRREAFLHVSEVASRWVKNIHEFLKEGQRVVARVHRVTIEKDQVDLSLRRVTEADKKLKMETYRREKRAQKLFELCAKKAKAEPGKAMETAGTALIEKYGDIYSALEKVSFTGDSAFEGLSLSDEWKKALTEVAVANIHLPEVVIGENVVATVYSPDAIDRIKEAFADVSALSREGSEISVHYLGAPRYNVRVKAADYKTAEKVLLEANEAVQRRLKGLGTVEFERQGAE